MKDILRAFLGKWLEEMGIQETTAHTVGATKRQSIAVFPCPQ